MIYCPYIPESHYLIINEISPPLLYYAMFPSIIGSLLLGFFIYFGSKRALVSKVLLTVIFSFVGYLIGDLFTWTSMTIERVMFPWSLLLVFQSSLYVSTLYLVYLLIDKKDVSFTKKLVFCGLVLPTIVLFPTDWNLSGFDLSGCMAFDAPLATYYVIANQALVLFWIIGLGIHRFMKAENRAHRTQIALIIFGVIFFLIAFSIATQYATFLAMAGAENPFEIEFYGILAVFAFLGVITYLIVHYEAFNVKLIGAQALVWALWILVSALLFLKDVPTIKVISVITLILLIGFGIALIRSVKREVEQRKQLELLTKKLTEVNEYLSNKVNEQTVEVRKAYDVEKKAKEDLEKLDKAKTQFILTTQHHLRTPLTVVSGTVKMLAEKAVGTIFAPADDLFFAKARAQSDKMATLIDEFVSIANLGAQDLLKKERLTILPSIQEVLEEAAEEATKKKLRIETSFAEDLKYVRVLLHPASFRNALANVIDNSIKYTPENGSLSIKGTVTRSTVKLTITDSGIGMTKEEQEKAFTSAFERGEEAKALYATGRGIGLIVSRNIIESHNGTIRAESLGRDHGTTVVIELPMVA